MKDCPECNVVSNGFERINCVDNDCGYCLRLSEYSDAIRIHNEIERLLDRTQGGDKDSLDALRGLAWNLVVSLYDRAGEMEAKRKREAEKAKAHNPVMSSLIDSTIELGFDAEK
jgi:hypothetical protein